MGRNALALPQELDRSPQISGPPATKHTEQQQARSRTLGSKWRSTFCAFRHVGEELEQSGVELVVVSFGTLQHPPHSSELLASRGPRALVAPPRPGSTRALLRR